MKPTLDSDVQPPCVVALSTYKPALLLFPGMEEVVKPTPDSDVRAGAGSKVVITIGPSVSFFSSMAGYHAPFQVAGLFGGMLLWHASGLPMPFPGCHAHMAGAPAWLGRKFAAACAVTASGSRTFGAVVQPR